MPGIGERGFRSTPLRLAGPGLVTVGVVLVLVRFPVIMIIITRVTEIVTMSCYRILLCSVPGCLDAGQLRDTAETEAGQNVNLISPHPLPPDHFQFPSCVSGLCQTSDKLIVTFV